MNTKMIPMVPMEITAEWDPKRDAFVTVSTTPGRFTAERVWAQLGLVRARNYSVGYTFVDVGPRAFVSGDCMSGVEPATLANFLATFPEKP